MVAQGYTEEDLEQLNALAKGLGVSLNEAKESPLFLAYSEKKQQEKKDKKARLGASRGSSITKPVSMSGLSKEDHMEAWRKANGME